jgi:branched-chain amino acid aminotransferase
MELESWQNGKWIPNSQIGTKMYDAHYFFGWAVFDSFRTFNKKPHMLDEHINRLYNSAKLAYIDFDMSKEKMKEIILEVIDRNKDRIGIDDELRGMFFVSPGYFKIYDDMGHPEPIVTINVTSCKRYTPHIAPNIITGLRTYITTQPQIPARFLDPKIKSCSRLHLGIADSEAGSYGKGCIPLLLDEHGYITESTGSNILVLKDGEVYTPDGAKTLDGVTHLRIKQLLEKNNIKINYVDWDVFRLIESDMVIYTSTFSGLMPSYSVIYRNKEYYLNKGKKSKMLYDKILSWFNEDIGLDIHEQWKEWYKDFNSS